MSLLAKELAKKPPLCLTGSKTLQDAKLAFERADVDVLAVVDEAGSIVGIITRRQLSALCKKNAPLTMALTQAMDTGYAMLRDTEEVRTMLEKDVDWAIVVDANDKVTGLFHKQDLFRIYHHRLELANSNLHAILNVIGIALLTIDKGGTITYVNAATKELLEGKGASILGSNIDRYLPQASLREVALAFNVNTSFTTEVNGRHFTVNAVPIQGRSSPTGAALVLRDHSKEEILRSQLHEEKNQSEILQTILDIAYDGIVVVDANGIITMMSKSYLKFLNKTPEQAIGKHVAEVIENTRMHIVVETGIPEIADIQRIKGSHMVATRIPIFNKGKVVGAIGKVLFRNIDDLESLYRKINKMEQQLEAYKGQLQRNNRARYSLADIIGRSELLNAAKRQAAKAAASDTNVLLLGESGVGKELFAQAIHSHSRRSNHPFIKVNCAAIPSEFMETELFGYEEGTFPGAKIGGKVGKFEAADGGTIFLDEIADMPLNMQAKILRVLQEREIEKIGSVNPQKIDVRVIVSSNQDLEAKVRAGALRQDLFYRINAWTLVIPPLRNRKEDIEDLAEHILDKYSHRYGKYVEKVSERAMSLLYKYAWPGNVRELENELSRAVGLLDNVWVVQPEHFSEKITGGAFPSAVKSLDEILLHAEKQAIVECIRICADNKSCAAKMLGISRSSLYEKILKHGLMQ